MPSSPRRSRAPAGRLGAHGPDGAEPTVAAEDFLKALHALTEEGEPATNGDLAARLELSPSTITWMLRRLAARHLIRHTPYRGVTLTPAGRLAALQVVRRHRLIETFLVEVVGYPKDRVHAEAERLEHVASETLVAAMSRLLGEPRRDPHGAPIPSQAALQQSRPFRPES